MIRKRAWEAIMRLLDEDALEFLADIGGRRCQMRLNAIELGILTTERS
ncbi:MAG: hypothetical protein ACLU4P_00170 [Ruminococcus sp.]